MKLLGNHLLFGLLFLCGLVSVQAQTTTSGTTAEKRKPTNYVLSTSARGLKSGEYGTFPITAQGTVALIGWQMGLRYNTDMLEFVGVSVGDLEGIKPESFGLTKVNEGEIRALWIAKINDASDHLQQGQHLFYLTFRAKKTVADVSSLLKIDDAVLWSEGYGSDGVQTVRFSLRGDQATTTTTSSKEGNWSVLCSPNPAADYFNLNFDLKTAGEFQLRVFDDFGRQVYFKNLNLDAGAQALKITEISQWAAGVYHWDLKGAANLKAEGHLVKL